VLIAGAKRAEPPFDYFFLNDEIMGPFAPFGCYDYPAADNRVFA
jgi:hypothetical protein